MTHVDFNTSTGTQISAGLFRSYLRYLIDRFFKILPIKESESEYGEESFVSYLQSLQLELLGCKELIVVLHDDPGVISLLGILQYLMDNPDCSVRTVKREVFRAISICNKLRARYTPPELEGDV